MFTWYDQVIIEMFIQQKTYLFHFLQEYFHSRVFEEGHIDKEEIVEAVSVPDGVSVNVVVAIPFLDVNPIAGSE